jgi:hypothetical protein
MNSKTTRGHNNSAFHSPLRLVRPVERKEREGVLSRL